MNFLERIRLKAMLKDCDFTLAQSVIREKFDLKNAEDGIADRVEDFLLDPCYKTARRMIDLDPIFAFYFKECTGNGLYVRNQKKKMQTQHLDSPVTNTQPVKKVYESSGFERPMRENPVPDLKTEKLPDSKVEQEIERTTTKPQVENPDEEGFPTNLLNDENTKLTGASETADASEYMQTKQFKLEQDDDREENMAEASAQEEMKEPAQKARTVKLPSFSLPPRKKRHVAQQEDEPTQPTSQTMTGTHFQTVQSEEESLTSSHSFDNVINTLAKDITQLEQEIARTEQEMENDFAKRIEGRAWIDVCEQGIAEFKEAVRILETVGNKKED